MPSYSNAVAQGSYARGYAPGAAASSSPAAQGGSASLTMTQFPAKGALTAIAGAVSGLTNPAGYEVAIYLEAGPGSWWSKPQPGDATQLSNTGTFTIANWASNPSVSALS